MFYKRCNEERCNAPKHNTGSSQIPRELMMMILCTIYDPQGTARKETLDLEDDICRSLNLSFHLVLSFLASQDALEVMLVSQWVTEWVTLRAKLTDVTLVSEDTYWRLYWEALIINDTYGGDVREIVVLIMEVNKVADEVTDIEIDK